MTATGSLTTTTRVVLFSKNAAERRSLRQAVERECGAFTEYLDLSEVNSALRRLSARARRRWTDPGHWVRVQVVSAAKPP